MPEPIYNLLGLRAEAKKKLKKYVSDKNITFYTFSKYDYVHTNISSGEIILIHPKVPKNLIQIVHRAVLDFSLLL